MGATHLRKFPDGRIRQNTSAPRARLACSFTHVNAWQVPLDSSIDMDSLYLHNMDQGKHITSLHCPDCGSDLRQLDVRPGHEAWACPVAIEAQRRKLLGKPGRKHNAVWIWQHAHAHANENKRKSQAAHTAAPDTRSMPQSPCGGQLTGSDR